MTEKTAGEDHVPTTATGPVTYGRVGWVDAAKGLCILLVVAGHANISLNTHGYDTGVWERISLMLGPVRMPLFFLLSGLFAAKALSESWRAFADRRVWIMVWLFVLWVPIREIWLALVPVTRVGHEGSIPAPNAFDGATWGPMLERIGAAALGPESYLWFLYALALYAVLSKLFRRVPPVIQIVVALGNSLWSPEWELDWPWNDITRNFVFYLLGMYTARWIHWLAQRRSLPIIAASAAAYTGLALWVDATHSHFNFGLNGPMRFIMAVTGIIAVVGAFAYMDGWRIMRPFSVVGSRTLPVFLMHIMVLATVMFVVDLVLPGDPGIPLQPLILAALAAVLCLALRRGLLACGMGWLFVRPAWLQRLTSPR